MRNCTTRTAVVSDLVVGHMPPWNYTLPSSSPHHSHPYTLLSGRKQPGHQSPFSSNKPIISLGPPCSKHSLFDSIFIWHNSTRVSSWSLHPLPRLNPPCSSATRFLPSTTYANLPWMMLHIALYGTETKDIPWNSSILHTPPPLFFGIGTITLFSIPRGPFHMYIHQLKRQSQKSTNSFC